eukprot:gene6147-8474_t
MTTFRLSKIVALLIIFIANLFAVNCSIVEDRKWYAEKIASKETGIFENSRIHVLRLSPGEDLLESLWRYGRVIDLRAATVVSCVGSLTQTNIRYANQETSTSLQGHFEIVSLVGNIDWQKMLNPETGNMINNSEEGYGHIHISVSDEQGVTIGGHLENSGNIIYTTAEITIVEIVDGLFVRTIDEVSKGGSGYKELKVLNSLSEL